MPNTIEPFIIICIFLSIEIIINVDANTASKCSSSLLSGEGMIFCPFYLNVDQPAPQPGFTPVIKISPEMRALAVLVESLETIR